ncbi:general transcription factor II-I repeat domain-containing protein 2-like [Phyllopteryx taeniolatus]|uniref:general transcription factor II-I repeat domain-containing protein 2-like n=1 Tax=Phyllopteryx taeniolatus TaxID=161469 RepID=UPI002AD1D1D6|nr:general transcription factor II-I repeat domain-containing protein 2-like [Phyllopteryx taeniolatus]XP_061641107.1 general transcription factor II-I repeat domain-containing protein 2-like [Phyllopteryx taeniolatus]
MPKVRPPGQIRPVFIFPLARSLCHKTNNMWPGSPKYTRNFIFHHRMAVNLWLNSRGAVLRMICFLPFSKMATGSKKRKVDSEGRRFQDKWKSEYFFTEFRNHCVCLICQETVAVFKEFNMKRHYQTEHANYDKLTGNERSEKLKQLEAGLTARQHFFTRASESNENTTKASYEVATLIAKHCKPFTEGEFIKDCVMKMVENICPEKKQQFANVFLARSTVSRRIEEVSSDIKRQLDAKGMEFEFFSLACDESTDASDSAQLRIFFRGVDSEMNVREELLDLQSLKDQTRGKDLFASVCSAVHDTKLKWNKITGIITDGAPAMVGEHSGLSTLVCNKVSEEGGKAIKLHCIIHQQVLCAKPFPWILVTFQPTCSWSSLSCSVTQSVAAGTNNSLLSTFTSSWIKTGSKRFVHLLRKC